MSVSQQLKFIAGFHPSWDWSKARDLLVHLELDETHLVHELSDGHKARLKFVAAFAWRSDIVLLDEPLKGIDRPSRRVIMSLLMEEFRSEDQTILFSTHHVEDVEASLDEVLVLKHGRLICHRGTDELRQAYQQPLVEVIEAVCERN